MPLQRLERHVGRGCAAAVREQESRREEGGRSGRAAGERDEQWNLSSNQALCKLGAYAGGRRLACSQGQSGAQNWAGYLASTRERVCRDARFLFGCIHVTTDHMRPACVSVWGGGWCMGGCQITQRCSLQGHAISDGVEWRCITNSIMQRRSTPDVRRTDPIGVQ